MASSFENNDAASFVKSLRKLFEHLRPSKVTRHGRHKTFIFKNLHNKKYVFIHLDTPKNSLQMPCSGSHKIISRNDKKFIIHNNGKTTTIAINRLKPVYVIEDETEPETSSHSETSALESIPPPLHRDH